MIMTMKLIIILSLLSSCALFQSHKKDSSPKLVVSEAGELNYSADEIAYNLTRDTTMGGGIYEISAMPLTKPFLEKRFQELASMRAVNQQDMSTMRKWHIDRYLLNRTCIDFDFNVTRFEESKQINQWKLAIEVDGDHIELEWLPENQAESIYVSQVRTPTHLGKRWHNRGIACAPVILPLWRGFSLKIQTAFVPWPFSSEAQLEWIFEALNVEDEAAIEERKKKNYQPYRGW